MPTPRSRYSVQVEPIPCRVTGAPLRSRVLAAVVQVAGDAELREKGLLFSLFTATKQVRARRSKAPGGAKREDGPR